MRRRIMPTIFAVLAAFSVYIKWTQPDTSSFLQIEDVSIVTREGAVYVKPEIYALRTFSGQYWTSITNAKNGRDVYKPQWSVPPRLYREGRRYREFEKLTWWTDQPILDLIDGQDYVLETCYRAVLTGGRMAEPLCIYPVVFTAPIKEGEAE